MRMPWLCMPLLRWASTPACAGRAFGSEEAYEKQLDDAALR